MYGQGNIIRDRPSRREGLDPEVGIVGFGAYLDPKVELWPFV